MADQRMRDLPDSLGWCEETAIAGGILKHENKQDCVLALAAYYRSVSDARKRSYA